MLVCYARGLRRRIFESRSPPSPRRFISYTRTGGNRPLQLSYDFSGMAEPQGKTKPHSKLRGNPRESEEVRTSKTLSWVLRHGSKSVGLYMRPDGYVRVTELLALDKLQSVNWEQLQQIVASDSKNRYSLVSEADKTSDSPTEVWWIRANQGHSIKDVVDTGFTPISSVADIPTKVAVHGTTFHAWNSIRKEGLNKMSRNHIHLAQGVPGTGVISGMRNSSDVYIYVNVQKAIDDGIQFLLSANGVVLTEGNEQGFLAPQYFERAVDKKGNTLDPAIEVPNTTSNAKPKKHAKKQFQKPIAGSAAASNQTTETTTVENIEKKTQQIVL